MLGTGISSIFPDSINFPLLWFICSPETSTRCEYLPFVRIRRTPSYTVARHQCEHQIFNDDNCAVAAVRFTMFFVGASRNFKDLAPFSASIFTERLNWKKPENKLNISSILIHFIQSCVRMQRLPKKTIFYFFFENAGKCGAMECQTVFRERKAWVKGCISDEKVFNKFLS